MIETTYVKEKLGIDVIDGEVVSWYPAEEVVKGLTKIVEDLLTKKKSVNDLYYAKQRKAYVDRFSRLTCQRKTQCSTSRWCSTTSPLARRNRAK